MWRKIKAQTPPVRQSGGLALLVCFILTHLVNSWADATLYQPITMQRANFPQISYPMTAGSSGKHGWLDLRARKKAEDQGSAEHRLLYPLRPLSVSAPSDHKNLLVVVDSLRADMLNNINMPNLQRYADNHFNFRQHMSGGNDEAMGMFSLFYGLPGHYYGDIRADKRPPCCSTRCCVRTTSSACSVHWKMPNEYRQSLLAGLRKQVPSPARPMTAGSSTTGSSGLARAPRTDPGSSGLSL